MEAIFPISALQKEQKEVKEAAKAGLVRITEQGRAAYVFVSEEALEKKIQEERAAAVYEAKLAEIIAEGRADVDAGRVYADPTEFFDDLRQEMKSSWK